MKRSWDGGPVAPMFEPHEIASSILAGLAGIQNAAKRAHLELPSAVPQPTQVLDPAALRGAMHWSAFANPQQLPQPQPSHTQGGVPGCWPQAGICNPAGLQQPPHLMPVQQVSIGAGAVTYTPQATASTASRHTASPVARESSDQQPQQQPRQQPQQQVQQQQPQQQLVPAADTGATDSSAPAATNAAGQAGPVGQGGSLLAQLQAQLELRQQAAAQQSGSRWQALRPLPATDPRPLQELQLLLPAIHAEYKAEMKLMLKACQIASSATKHQSSGPEGAILLMDPASREQLQRQVLGNCNEKHMAVAAAFKHAAQAVAAAAAGSAGFSDNSQLLLQHQQQQVGPADLSTAVNTPGTAASAVAAATTAAAGLIADLARVEDVLSALQQLRSSYQHELVAATSALFAICRGFGQRAFMGSSASQTIKAALAGAQRQHTRVEQLWQDILVAAGGA